MSMQDALYIINAHFGSTDKEVSIIELGLITTLPLQSTPKMTLKFFKLRAIIIDNDNYYH